MHLKSLNSKRVRYLKNDGSSVDATNLKIIEKGVECLPTPLWIFKMGGEIYVRIRSNN